MSAISVKKYKIEESEADGMYHLYYSRSGLSFDYTLASEKTANAGGLLFVMKKEKAEDTGGDNG
jgi:hypothetical protein